VDAIRKKDTVTLQSELKSSKSIEQFVEENQAEFNTMDVPAYLNEMLKKYNLEKSDIAKRGGFAGQYPYQIFNGKKKASREKMIQIAFGFPLTLEEAQCLLRLGECAELYIRDSRDAFIMFALEKQYTLQQLNELLHKNGKKIIE